MFLKTFGITALLFTFFIFLGGLTFEVNIDTDNVQLNVGSFWIGIIVALAVSIIIRLIVVLGHFLDKKTEN